MSSTLKKTLILGASSNPERYSFLALNRLLQHHHPVEAIGSKKETVAGIDIHKEKKPIDGVDTVTVYLNPANQKEYYDYIVSLHPRRVIFNPGAENEELATLLKKNGIQPVEACTLVLLGTGQF